MIKFYVISIFIIKILLVENVNSLIKEENSKDFIKSLAFLIKQTNLENIDEKDF